MNNVKLKMIRVIDAECRLFLLYNQTKFANNRLLGPTAVLEKRCTCESVADSAEVLLLPNSSKETSEDVQDASEHTSSSHAEHGQKRLVRMFRMPVSTHPPAMLSEVRRG